MTLKFSPSRGILSRIHLWPLPPAETVALAIYLAFWFGVAFGAVLQLESMGRAQ